MATKATRQRQYRQRRKAGVAVDRVPVPPVVVEALVAQGIDAGLTEEQAEAESRNPQKRAAALAAVQANWARGYLARRNRSS